MRYILTSTEGRILVMTHKGMRFLETAQYDALIFNRADAVRMKQNLGEVFPHLIIDIQEYQP